MTGRYDQIRCSLAYSKAPVVLIGTHAGMAIGRDGVTQMGLEDIALMRALPGMTIYSPATASEAKEITKYLATTQLDGPVYLRLGRQPVEDFDTYTKSGYKKFKVSGEEGKALSAIVSTGCMLSQCLEVGKINNLDVYHISKLKPFSPSMIFILESYNRIYTVEDHSIIGGLGSLLCEELQGYTTVERIGLDGFPESGKPEDLYEKYGLSVEKILERCK